MPSRSQRTRESCLAHPIARHRRATPTRRPRADLARGERADIVQIVRSSDARRFVCGQPLRHTTSQGRSKRQMPRFVFDRWLVQRTRVPIRGRDRIACRDGRSMGVSWTSGRRRAPRAEAGRRRRPASLLRSVVGTEDRRPLGRRTRPRCVIVVFRCRPVGGRSILSSSAATERPRAGRVSWVSVFARSPPSSSLVPPCRVRRSGCVGDQGRPVTSAVRGSRW